LREGWTVAEKTRRPDNSERRAAGGNQHDDFLHSKNFLIRKKIAT
jgi:hypothetical protein